MNARTIAFRLAFVTPTTVNRFGSEIVVRMVVSEIGMATGAAVGRMGRSCKFCRIHEQREHFSRSVGLRQRFVRMTFQAVTVSQCCRSNKWPPNPERGRDQALSPNTHTNLRSWIERASTPRTLPNAA